MKRQSQILFIVRSVSNDIAKLYPGFLAFYILCVAVSHFYPAWNSYFYWPAFHISIVALGVVSLLSQNVRTVISNPLHTTKSIRQYFIGLNKWDYFKALVVSVVAGVASYMVIGPVNTVILVYAIISVLWITGSRTSACLALALLAVCPILLIIKQNVLAEVFAVYAYYFFVIAVIVQIREYRQKHVIKSKGKAYAVNPLSHS